MGIPTTWTNVRTIVAVLPVFPPHRVVASPQGEVLQVVVRPGEVPQKNGDFQREIPQREIPQEGVHPWIIVEPMPIVKRNSHCSYAPRIR